MAKEEKVSFAFASKSSSSSRPKRPQPFEETLPQNPNSSNPQFVTVFDPTQTLDSTPNLVIPPIPNSDFRHATTKRMKNLSLPNEEEPDSSQQQFVVEELDSNASDNISYGLTLRSNNSDPNKQQEEEKDLTLKRFREDMKNLPDDRGMDEFKEVAIEDFAAAVLAGYGWSEGKGIGRNNKGDTKVVQYDRKAGTQGLGYEPKPNDSVVKVKKGREMIYVVNKNGKSSDVSGPKIVRIVSGRHVGLKGEILKRLDGSDIVLKLVGSGEKVTVDEEMVAELGSEAEERCLKKLKELEIRAGGEKGEKKEKEIHDRREKGERKELEIHDGRRKGERKERKEFETRDRREKEEMKGKKESREKRWLRSHIRVRIISKDFRGGKWYLKKGEVMDVVGPTTCDVSMDGTGELVQGVDQKILETALPKRGGSVVVLYGQNAGVYGSLVDRNMEEETGVVRDAESHDLINVRLEQIAEYVGDPSYLGY